MTKPLILYHGSRFYYEKLVPHQAIGHGEMDNFHGIYAIENPKIAKFFALSLQGIDSSSRFEINFSEDGELYLKLVKTHIDWNVWGYLYHLDAEPFQTIDQQQWVATEELTPLKVERIDPLSLRQWIISE